MYRQSVQIRLLNGFSRHRSRDDSMVFLARLNLSLRFGCIGRRRYCFWYFARRRRCLCDVVSYGQHTQVRGTGLSFHLQLRTVHGFPKLRDLSKALQLFLVPPQRQKAHDRTQAHECRLRTRSVSPLFGNHHHGAMEGSSSPPRVVERKRLFMQRSWRREEWKILWC